MDKTTVMVYFSIHGDDFDPDSVTHFLGVEPTETKVKGEVQDGRKRPNIETSWKVSTKQEVSLDVNKQFHKIIELLAGKKEELRKLKSSIDVNYDFVIVVKIENNEKPEMHFDLNTLSFVGYIGAEIDIDLYVYS